jgi:hypothetical protein
MARKLPLHWCADSPECVLKARVFSPPRVNCMHHRLKNTIEISAKIGIRIGSANFQM